MTFLFSRAPCVNYRSNSPALFRFKLCRNLSVTAQIQPHVRCLWTCTFVLLFPPLVQGYFTYSPLTSAAWNIPKCLFHVIKTSPPYNYWNTFLPLVYPQGGDHSLVLLLYKWTPHTRLLSCSNLIHFSRGPGAQWAPLTVNDEISERLSFFSCVIV